MPSRRPARKYVSIAEAAAHAGCNAKTIRRRISAGELTGYRFGTRLIRVDLNELDDLLKPIPAATNGPDDAA